MARNQSFALTTQQYIDQTKTVARRNGWLFAKAGDVCNGVEKCQGLKKGEKVVKLGQHRIVEISREPLRRLTDDLAYGYIEVILEGFPRLSPLEFVQMYCEHNKCTPDTIVTRMEFEYL